jgi:hypothetical protein
MLNIPLRTPEAVGVKAIETVQPTLGPRLDPQVLAVILKSVPLTDGVWSAIAAVLVFETVMFCAGLVALIVVEGKLRLIGFSMMAAAAPPVPESAAVAWPPGTFPKTVSTPLRFPVAVGRKRI